jgi:NhaP-type Na+/H+ and K+/H+ antiporter
LNAESGANDPMAVALTLGLIAWIEKPGYGVDDLLVLLVRQLGLGPVIGVALGPVARRLLPRLPNDLARPAVILSTRKVQAQVESLLDVWQRGPMPTLVDEIAAPE